MGTRRQQAAKTGQSAGMRRSAQPLSPTLVALAVLAATGCSTLNSADLAPTGMNCVDDSPRCVAERSEALSRLAGDPSKSWIKQRASARAYASGVRLFAFKTFKQRLTCAELAIGRREAEAGPSILRGPQGRELTPAQVSRGVMLSSEVNKDLSRELRRRKCKV